MFILKRLVCDTSWLSLLLRESQVNTESLKLDRVALDSSVKTLITTFCCAAQQNVVIKIVTLELVLSLRPSVPIIKLQCIKILLIIIL